MTKIVDVGRLELAVQDEGQGPPIVLIHGFPLDHSMWRAQLDTLAKNHRVIAPDLRGFGASQAIPGTSTMQQMADDVASLLDALDVREPVVFCGLSMGGYVAWQFWLRHRERVGKLVLCDTRAIADTVEAAKGRHETAAKVLAEGPRPVWAAMRGKLFAPATIEQKPELVETFEQVVLKNSAEGIAAALRGMAERSDVTAELPQINVPTLVLVGEHDAISSPDEMRAIADQIPGARFVVIPSAGHMAPVENPGAVNEAIEGFI